MHRLEMSVMVYYSITRFVIPLVKQITMDETSLPNAHLMKNRRMTTREAKIVTQDSLYFRMMHPMATTKIKTTLHRDLDLKFIMKEMATLPNE